MQVAAGNTAICGGSLTTTSSGSIAVSGALVAPGSQCVVNMTVTGTAAGNDSVMTNSVNAWPNLIGNTASATIQVGLNPPVLNFTLMADQPIVAAGKTIGFQAAFSNQAGAGTASGIAISELLPAGAGINWTLADFTSGMNCSITGAASSQALACTVATLAAGNSVNVHVISSTTSSSAGSYSNKATASAANAHQSVQASATVVVQAVPAIIWPTPAPITYGTNLSAILDATAQNGSKTVPGFFAYTAMLAGGASNAVTAATILDAGSYTLSTNFTPTDTTDYTAASATVTLTVNIAPQTIGFPAITSTEYATTTLTLSATASSGLPISFASTTPAVCTVSGSTASLHIYGICTIQASQVGNANYAAAKTVAQSITVHHEAQTINFATIPATPLSVGSFTLSATASSGLTVSFASTTSTVCTVSADTVTLLTAGKCGIVATQAGNGVYMAAAPVGHLFAVTLAPHSEASR